MPAILLFFVVEPFHVWLNRRAERKARLIATDGLSRSPDALLRDIGISRDELMSLAACAKRSMQ